jgi:hypothetical protein
MDSATNALDHHLTLGDRKKMDEHVLVTTRQSLHGVAELLIAGPQFRSEGTIKLKVTPGGFGGFVSPVRVAGTELVWPGGRVELAGTCAELAATIGVEPGPPGNYSDASGLSPHDTLAVDPTAAELLEDWYARGDAALRDFALRAGAPDAGPILWPEHLDLAISVDEVNYGVSPGDGGHQQPYAYVGPWTPPAVGGFWNAPFGALRGIDELPDVEAVTAFFADGRAAARP